MTSEDGDCKRKDQATPNSTANSLPLCSPVLIQVLRGGGETAGTKRRGVVQAVADTAAIVI